MDADSLSRRAAQLDKAEREHLEDVVEDLRERVEDNARYQLTREGLDEEPAASDTLDDETRQLVEAIELEAVDGHTWDEAFEQYVTGVGYTIVNRLAALRCMEVRDFVDEEVTVFKGNGLTPAAETLVHEEFLLEDEAILEAYHNACDELAEEIEILFDRSSAYSQIDPDDDTFEALCRLLDEVPDEVWRADDVLGWVYEYYNRPVVESLDAKNTLEPDDVGPANQFYTPHWVVRMLADNSLGKLYLEATDQADAVPEPAALSPEARKDRLVTPEEAPSVPELCTYLIPDEGDQDAPSFDHPSELRVIDPACGSGHFLLYAFDILERIWWAESDDIARSAIPAKILEHNLYGVDIDLRSCQLSAFNLYLKARTRAEDEGADDFEMPNVGIVCADARVAEVEEAVDILDGITGEGTDVREALDEIIHEFQTTEALGSLLDVQGELEDEFMEEQTDVMEWGGEGPHTLNEFLRTLESAVEERTSDSFGEQNLRSFLHLLVVLTRNYDVALMNPPYGSQGRIPSNVRKYLEEEYRYTAEYYINFFEQCESLTRENGRVGMIVPRTFMFKRSLQEFREDFIGRLGTFDFLTEYGDDVLDNATVRTAGTVVRTGTASREQPSARFIRLHDVSKDNKERVFLETAFGTLEDRVERNYNRNLAEFSLIPGSPLSYWLPEQIRSVFDSDIVFDANNGGVDKRSAGSVKAGLTTGDNSRFIYRFWENNQNEFVPYAKGGQDAWLLPRIDRTIYWGENGNEVKRHSGSYPRNEEYYFEEVLTYTYLKEGGRRFGYLNPGSLFDHAGKIFAPTVDTWSMLGYANTHLITYLMLGQTPDRHWEVSHVSKLPWPSELEESGRISELPREAVGYLISKRQYEFNSPYYRVPVLLDVLGVDDLLPQYDHPHRELRGEVMIAEPDTNTDTSTALNELGIAAAKHLESIEANLLSCADAMDDVVFDCFDITADQREMVLQEIALRTNEDPYERKNHDPESITEPSADFPEQVKNLLLHFTLRAVHGSDDGIVPISAIKGEENLLTYVEDEFERLWGDHADARLAEVDQILGTRSADEEAYPNLRAWLEDDLFDYHVSAFDRTPILWRFTTDRLVSDPEGEGFACLVDYHQLDAGIFDRLQNRYLEPRKALLREQRSAANRRRGDESLSASEQADAAEEYARCESGLEQIAVFEDRLADLAQPEPREWPEENRQVARAAAERVAEFRERTAARLETLADLAALPEVDMGDLFSPSFYETVQANREEWLDALDDLETAFEAYAAAGDESVEAHLYDLFEYYDDLVGSTHYASNGILFTTYYYDQFEDAGQAQIGEGGVSDRQRLCSELASGLDEYEALANEIGDACDGIVSDIPSDWSDRALSEITTEGYRPNHKHGVEINVTPLAQAEIVPKTVDDDVL